MKSCLLPLPSFWLGNKAIFRIITLFQLIQIGIIVNAKNSKDKICTIVISANVEKTAPTLQATSDVFGCNWIVDKTAPDNQCSIYAGKEMLVNLEKIIRTTSTACDYYHAFPRITKNLADSTTPPTPSPSFENECFGDNHVCSSLHLKHPKSLRYDFSYFRSLAFPIHKDAFRPRYRGFTKAIFELYRLCHYSFPECKMNGKTCQCNNAVQSYFNTSAFIKIDECKRDTYSKKPLKNRRDLFNFGGICESDNHQIASLLTKANRDEVLRFCKRIIDDCDVQIFEGSDFMNSLEDFKYKLYSTLRNNTSDLDQFMNETDTLNESGVDEGEDLLKDYENEDFIENSTLTAGPKNETTPMLVTIKIDEGEEISGSGGVIKIEGTTEVENITEAVVTSNLQPDGIECNLRIEGLQGKDRWLWKSYPDLYYVLKVDEIELSNSKQEIKQNRLDAEWSFTLPNHFKGEERVKVEFYDKDVWNKDDLIGSAEFESSKLNEEICDEEDDGDDADYYYSAENVPCDEMVKLDAGTSPYRKDDTKYLMACEEKWINV